MTPVNCHSMLAWPLWQNQSALNANEAKNGPMNGLILWIWDLSREGCSPSVSLLNYLWPRSCRDIVPLPYDGCRCHRQDPRWQAARRNGATLPIHFIHIALLHGVVFPTWSSALLTPRPPHHFTLFYPALPPCRPDSNHPKQAGTLWRSSWYFRCWNCLLLSCDWGGGRQTSIPTTTVVGWKPFLAPPRTLTFHI